MALELTLGDQVSLPCKKCYRLGLPATVAAGEWKIRCQKCGEEHTVTIERRRDGWRILIQATGGDPTILE